MTVLEKSWARSCFSSVLGVKVMVSWRARSAYPTGPHCPLELIWPGSPLFFQIPHSLLSLELQTHSCRRSLGLILNFAQTLFLQLLSWLCPPQLLQQVFFFFSDGLFSGRSVRITIFNIEMAFFSWDSSCFPLLYFFLRSYPHKWNICFFFFGLSFPILVYNLLLWLNLSSCRSLNCSG